ncbi:CopD family protein [Pseudomonadales bacterium]|nr:CopD family protein [Pseudomonadales bacterium]MDC0174497.1 CopD family protein [Pseudomonadales bacterium]|tara:strand:- start:126 stop:539 length:414 start_codon:yes stop_codon:yes gene_type:complete
MLWIKTFHILFVMAWMAGLFYLPRILVHYVEGKQAEEDVQRLIIMGQKLFRFSSVMALLALGLGTWLWLSFGFSGNWLLAKLGFVVLLLAYHGQSFRYIQQMALGQTIRTSLFFRIYNELALLIVIPILILVVVKPF